jgi:predicted nucleic acid-binding protein
MTRRKGLVLDANILLRAVLGQRVRELLEAFEHTVTFYSPDVCFDDARKHIPDVSSRRRIDPLPVLAVLEEVSNIVESVDESLYEDFETVARERVTSRDPDDWPVVAGALLLDFPIWTEAQMFRGFREAQSCGSQHVQFEEPPIITDRVSLNK